VINIEVSKAVAKHGLYYAPDPASQIICTIGGNIAFNSGGVHCLKYGMTSNHILAIKAVLPDGEVVQPGARAWRMSGLIRRVVCRIGGLVRRRVEITLRLLPKPERFRTVLAAIDAGSAGDAVAAVVASGLLPRRVWRSWIT
jgi:glycolate oxidase